MPHPIGDSAFVFPSSIAVSQQIHSASKFPIQIGIHTYIHTYSWTQGLLSTKKKRRHVTATTASKTWRPSHAFIVPCFQLSPIMVHANGVGVDSYIHTSAQTKEQRSIISWGREEEHIRNILRNKALSSLRQWVILPIFLLKNLLSK